MPETSAASSAFSAGIKSCESCFSRASSAIESAPRIGRKVPSSASSPANSLPVGSKRNSSAASRYESATDRSNAAPSFLSSAGASEMTIFLLVLFGEVSPLFLIADATRSRASSTALSGSPTILNACNPRPISASTDTRCAEGSDGCAPKTRAKFIPLETQLGAC